MVSTTVKTMGCISARSEFRGRMTLLSTIRAYMKCRSTIFSLMAINLAFKTPTWSRNKLSNVKVKVTSINTPHCLHCGGDHGSDSFNSLAYSFEKEVIAVATTEKISMRDARRRVQSRYVREGVSYAQTLKTKRPSSRRVATTPSTPSPVVTTTSSTLNSSTVVVPPSMVSTVNTTSITNISSTLALKSQFTAEKQVDSSGAMPKIRPPSSLPLPLKTSKMVSSSSKSKKPNRFLIHSEEALNSTAISKKHPLSKESKNKETKRSQVFGKRSLGSPERTSLELSPKRASRIETNINTQDSAANESLEKDLVTASVNVNTRDIVADDPLEKTLAAITGESTSLKVENLSESRRISLIYDLPMPPAP